MVCRNAWRCHSDSRLKVTRSESISSHFYVTVHGQSLFPRHNLIHHLWPAFGSCNHMINENTASLASFLFMQQEDEQNKKSVSIKRLPRIKEWGMGLLGKRFELWEKNAVFRFMRNYYVVRVVLAETCLLRAIKQENTGFIISTCILSSDRRQNLHTIHSGENMRIWMNTHTEQNVDFCQIKISMTNLIFKIKQFYAYNYIPCITSSTIY